MELSSSNHKMNDNLQQDNYFVKYVSNTVEHLEASVNQAKSVEMEMMSS
jgi:hypothetical protein